MGTNVASAARRAAIAVAIVASLGTALALAQSKPLEGMTFVGEISERGSQRGDRSEFTFKDGKFRSSVCTQHGFGDGVYKATVEGGVIAFETETVSEEYGRQVWKAVVRGHTLEGTAVWYRKPSLFRPNPDPVERVVKAAQR